MALKFPFRFAVVMYGEDGTNLGTVPVRRDWESALDWTRFYFQRKGCLALDDRSEATVIPLWQHACGEPYCRGYRIEIERRGLGPVAAEFSITTFREFASSVATCYVASGKMKAGEYYCYKVVAYPANVDVAKTGGIAVIDASPAPPVQEGSIEAWMKRASANGAINPDDMPVFVSRRVLREAEAQTLKEEGTETGGILLGTLIRDTPSGELFAKVSAQISAEHTIGSEVKLTFTSKTWAAADAALKLRGRGECFQGYWHSHPYRFWQTGINGAMKTNLSEAFEASQGVEFFSVDDEAIMRAIFPRAWCVGIVATDTIDGVRNSMYGLRNGTMQARGFYVLDEEEDGGA
jgi:hypothetical protein